MDNRIGELLHQAAEHPGPAELDLDLIARSARSRHRNRKLLGAGLIAVVVVANVLLTPLSAPPPEGDTDPTGISALSREQDPADRELEASFGTGEAGIARLDRGSARVLVEASGYVYGLATRNVGTQLCVVKRSIALSNVGNWTCVNSSDFVDAGYVAVAYNSAPDDTKHLHLLILVSDSYIWAMIGSERRSLQANALLLEGPTFPTEAVLVSSRGAPRTVALPQVPSHPGPPVVFPR